MQKKAKEEIIEGPKKVASKAKTPSKTSKTTSKTTKTTKKVATKSTAKKSSATKVAKKSTSKTGSTKTTKSATTKVTKSTKSATKTTKSVTTKANKSTKVAAKTTKRATKSTTKKKPVVEYYDLPGLYDQTVVKILAQTPTIIFVYWDISTEDKQNYISKYGQDFFSNTAPYLVVTNMTKNYSFEVEINDYANSWYIHITDSDCKYDVTLIRKARNNNISLDEGYVSITSSNHLQTPNDHILFESLGKNIFFKNIHTNVIEVKDISSLSFMSNIGRIYNIYDLYKEIYKNELSDDKLDSKLTSSKMSS